MSSLALPERVHALIEHGVLKGLGVRFMIVSNVRTGIL